MSLHRISVHELKRHRDRILTCERAYAMVPAQCNYIVAYRVGWNLRIEPWVFGTYRAPTANTTRTLAAHLRTRAHSEETFRQIDVYVTDAQLAVLYRLLGELQVEHPFAGPPRRQRGVALARISVYELKRHQASILASEVARRQMPHRCNYGVSRADRCRIDAITGCRARTCAWNRD